jgi:streptogramin lyase
MRPAPTIAINTLKEIGIMLKRRSGIRLALIAIASLIPQVAFAEILVASYTGSGIVKYDEATGAPLGPLVNFGSVPFPAGMAIGPDNVLYVSSQATAQGQIPGNDAILKFNPFTGAFLGTFATLPQAYSPAGLAFDSTGRLYVSRFGVYGVTVGLGTVDRFQLNGTPDGTVVSGLTNPTFLTFDGSGNLYVSNFNGGTGGSIKKYNGTTTSDFVAPGGGGLMGPQGLTFGPGNSLYVADQVGEAVRRYDATTGTPQPNFISGGPLVNDFVTDILFDRFGQFLATTLGPDFMTPQGDILRFNALTGVQILPNIDTNFPSPSAFILTPVPEPSSLILAGVALGGYAWNRWRRRTQA